MKHSSGNEKLRYRGVELVTLVLKSLEEALQLAWQDQTPEVPTNLRC